MWCSSVLFSRALAVNHAFFAGAARRGIWSEEVAWLYGWMVADGNVTHYRTRLRRQPQINLGVHHKDRDVVEKMKLWLRSEHKISESSQIKDGRAVHMSKLSFNSASMAEDLAVLGIVPRKTNITYLHESLLLAENSAVLRHAVRGVLEGDGCITYEERRNTWRVCFSGTHQLLSSLQAVLNAYLVASGARRKVLSQLKSALD